MFAKYCLMKSGAITLLLTLSALTLSSCSLSPKPIAKSDGEIKSFSLDLFAARGFLGGSDYEHYTIKDGLMWRECGSVVGKKIVEAENRSSSLNIRQKRLESLTADEQAPIILALKSVVEEYQADNKLPKPESVRSIRDGGLFELTASGAGGNLEMATSVDALSEPKKKVLDRTKELFKTIRSVGPLICDSQTFFGVGRR